MEQFNWQDSVRDLTYKTWMENKGSKVKIALLDTGVDLKHPALRHLDVPGRKINVAAPGFDLKRLGDFSNSDVADEFPDNGHGTPCASVLAAQPEAAFEMSGVAPRAEFCLIKLTKPGKTSALVAHFLLGIEAALAVGADIIVSTVRFSKKRYELERVPEAAVNRVFDLVRQSGVLFFNSLPNVEPGEPWAEAATANFPNRRPEVVNVGVVHAVNFEAERPKIVAEPGTHLLLNAHPCTLCKTGGGYQQKNLSSSYAACLVGGLAALCLSSIKKREGVNFQPRKERDILLAMGKHFEPLADLTAFPTDGVRVFRNAPLSFSEKP